MEQFRNKPQCEHNANAETEPTDPELQRQPQPEPEPEPEPVPVPETEVEAAWQPQHKFCERIEYATACLAQCAQ